MFGEFNTYNKWEALFKSDWQSKFSISLLKDCECHLNSLE
jgi:hypothetical protein